MSDTKTIKSKLQSIENIRKITKAMELVARSKMKKTIDRVLAIRPYAFFALEFLVNFSTHSSAVSSFFIPADGNKTLIVEIAANKGLCGGYNSNMYREIRTYISSIEKLDTIDYIAVGKYAVQHVKKLNGNVLRAFTDFSPDVSYEQIQTLSHTIFSEWKTGNYKKIIIGFTTFKSTLSQKPVVKQLLPLSAEMFKNQIFITGGEENWTTIPQQMYKRNWSQFIIEPSETAILELIIPKLITVQIYHALLDAYASEESSRMVAMKSATENADKLGNELLLSFNHLRQEGITRELSEIAAGNI